MKRYLIAFGIVASLSALVLTARHVQAAPSVAPVDIYGGALRDGDLISANVSAGDPDIFIIKLLVGNSDLRSPDVNGYARLFLNPAIFNMYGHLGGFSRVRQVSASVRDSFETTAYYRNCETNDRRVWAVEVTGEDDGILHHVEISGDAAVSEDRYFFSKVFCINSREDNFYAKSIHPYTRLADVPRYHRRVCMQRPACLDSEPRCLMPEPAEGWCPRGCYYQQVQCVRAPCEPVLVCPSPTPSPTAEISSVVPQVTRQSNGLNLYSVAISGQLPNRCYNINSPFSRSVNRFDINLSFTSNLGPNQGACAPEAWNYSTTVNLGDSSALSDGTYTVYVNGNYWASFTVTSGSCFVGGCSSELCTDSPNAVSTCQYRSEYACYQYARCERQLDGTCNWTPGSSQYEQCRANPPVY